MEGRRLDRISARLGQVRKWMGDDGYRRAASVPGNPSQGLRDRRAEDLRLLLARDLPELIRTVREYNLRGQQGKCRYCGQQLRLIRGPRAGLYASSVTPEGVLLEDPNCPSPDSPDGKHLDGREPKENGEP